MQKNTEDSKKSKLNWDKIQKNLDQANQDEQLAWMDTEGEDAGVERQKTTDSEKPAEQ